MRINCNFWYSKFTSIPKINIFNRNKCNAIYNTIQFSMNWLSFLEKYRILKLTSSLKRLRNSFPKSRNHRKLQSIFRNVTTQNYTFASSSFYDYQNTIVKVEYRYLSWRILTNRHFFFRPEFTLYRQINPKEYLRSIVTSFHVCLDDKIERFAKPATCDLSRI